MKIQVDDPVIKDWFNYDVIDLDTGEPLKYVISADDDTGEYEAYVTDSNGQVTWGFDGAFREIRKGNIKIQRKK